AVPRPAGRLHPYPQDRLPPRGCCATREAGVDGRLVPPAASRRPRTTVVRTLRATLEYDGTDFHGFQVQLGLPTVQAAVEANLARITGEAIRIAAAGRTDAGVHATGQVISFATGSTIPTDRLAVALNSLAPYSV